MQGASILVVDDDKEIADLVEIHLVSDGYKVFKANSAKEGMKIFESNEIQLMILDIMMPEIDGLTMCEMVRKTSNIPIIMLSAKSTDLDKIVGLSTGADDYMIKPFNPLELMARVKSQLRRFTTFNGTKEKEKEIIVVNNLIIDVENHIVKAYDEEVKLTPIEFKILSLLAGNPGKVFSTDEIFEQVWNEKMYEANNTVMVHIRRLREKIEVNPREAQIIKTVWGVGYKIDG
ncbi:MAG: response regulator transcription factor [Lachnospiraceae bacterium]|nr:response regulator transcription factor [Lachnospiraceae bacterium]